MKNLNNIHQAPSPSGSSISPYLQFLLLSGSTMISRVFLTPEANPYLSQFFPNQQAPVLLPGHPESGKDWYGNYE
ncbi:MAG: hypothetical protein J0G98_18895 [Terrimonas ferruginea]|uniref:hypothetical protein n=1 Tax=Terrimonas ferruginea TaxID=249 RepID=UPI00092C9BCE|nr:hypothetical protein [Terrimonas ferruginea]MBN8785135.1 hypothetical protein [Terrimonas ferruginea]OJW41547.1 MAG: hypothetical protein BGO56_10340 [Sphingobacteriales bacterium 48-107]